jgi:2'-5' RNA ligase
MRNKPTDDYNSDYASIIEAVTGGFDPAEDLLDNPDAPTEAVIDGYYNHDDKGNVTGYHTRIQYEDLGAPGTAWECDCGNEHPDQIDYAPCCDHYVGESAWTAFERTTFLESHVGGDDFWREIAFKLEPPLVYHAAIRLWAEATCEGFPRTAVSELTVADAIGWYESNYLREDSYEVSDRYSALGITPPEPGTCCEGHCEGTGYVPICGYDFDPPLLQVPEGKERSWCRSHMSEEEQIAFRDLWLQAESENPCGSDDIGYHFVKCPDCHGTGRTDGQSVWEGVDFTLRRKTETGASTIIESADLLLRRKTKTAVSEGRGVMTITVKDGPVGIPAMNEIERVLNQCRGVQVVKVGPGPRGYEIVVRVDDYYDHEDFKTRLDGLGVRTDGKNSFWRESIQKQSLNELDVGYGSSVARCFYCGRDQYSPEGWVTERYGTLKIGKALTHDICPDCVPSLNETRFVVGPADHSAEAYPIIDEDSTVYVADDGSEDRELVAHVYELERAHQIADAVNSLTEWECSCGHVRPGHLTECRACHDTITEAKDVHKFSNTMVRLGGDAGKAIKKFAKGIADDDLYTDPDDDSFGREDDPHITVKYGIHSVDPKSVTKAINGSGTIKVKLGKLSVFDSADDYDVLKADVTSPQLRKLNKAIAGSTKVTDTHPEYKPHATIAYLKKGKAAQYAGDETLNGMEIELDAVVFSGKDGKETSIPLKETTLSSKERADFYRQMKQATGQESKEQDMKEITIHLGTDADPQEINRQIEEAIAKFDVVTIELKHEAMRRVLGERIVNSKKVTIKEAGAPPAEAQRLIGRITERGFAPEAMKGGYLGKHTGARGEFNVYSTGDPEYLLFKPVKNGIESVIDIPVKRDNLKPGVLSRLESVERSGGTLDVLAEAKLKDIQPNDRSQVQSVLRRNKGKWIGGDRFKYPLGAWVKVLNWDGGWAIYDADAEASAPDGITLVLVNITGDMMARDIRTDEISDWQGNDPKPMRESIEELTVPDRNQLKVLKQVLRAPDAMVGVMGGGFSSKEEVREILRTKFGYSDSQIAKMEESTLDEYRPGSPVDIGRKREAALIRGIIKLAKKYRVGPVDEGRLRIDARGNIMMLQQMTHPSGGEYVQDEELPENLKQLALKYNRGYKGPGEISGRWITLNHFDWEKLLRDQGLIESINEQAKDMIWMRMGDADDYHEHGIDMNAAAGHVVDFVGSSVSAGDETVQDVLNDMAWLQGGLEVGSFYGHNYISLYWGDKNADKTRDFSKADQRAFTKELKTELSDLGS